MSRENYSKQVNLLLDCLLPLQEHARFALKGGTAINLFYQNMPRLSVDIDLAYIPFSDSRDEDLKQIKDGLLAIKAEIERNVQDIKVGSINTAREDYKLSMQRAGVTVKLEVNYNMRGALEPLELRDITEPVENKFTKFVGDIPVLSFNDLYAGKICAALARQHPRDLFDLKQLMDGPNWLTPRLRQALCVYICCSNRPMHELINPNELDIQAPYENEFEGMVEEGTTSLEELYAARRQLLSTLRQSWTETEKKFMLNIAKGEPIAGLLEFERVELLPAIKFKAQNIHQLRQSNRAKFNHQIQLLKQALSL